MSLRTMVQHRMTLPLGSLSKSWPRWRSKSFAGPFISLIPTICHSSRCTGILTISQLRDALLNVTPRGVTSCITSWKLTGALVSKRSTYLMGIMESSVLITYSLLGGWSINETPFLFINSINNPLFLSFIFIYYLKVVEGITFVTLSGKSVVVEQ